MSFEDVVPGGGGMLTLSYSMGTSSLLSSTTVGATCRILDAPALP
eukprot:CAMPEP_0114315658 /NCGR_PEP_ID=MMETSP0059-20121206/22680_1 /TAXON_ID=36894 /ORGANISM="Pyramimonas parkeae, Strain CCMP726" /LENGTH=44 /DNA_ID= /DNA_START= /DNA_END= /DNA_ORIENTATION=